MLAAPTHWTCGEADGAGTYGAGRGGSGITSPGCAVFTAVFGGAADGSGAIDGAIGGAIHDAELRGSGRHGADERGAGAPPVVGARAAGVTAEAARLGAAVEARSAARSECECGTPAPPLAPWSRMPTRRQGSASVPVAAALRFGAAPRRDGRGACVSAGCVPVGWKRSGGTGESRVATPGGGSGTRAAGLVTGVGRADDEPTLPKAGDGPLRSPSPVVDGGGARGTAAPPLAEAASRSSFLAGTTSNAHSTQIS